MVAQFLGLPHVGGVVKLDCDSESARAESEIEGGREVVECALPAVFTVERGLNEPRTAPITGVMKAMRTTTPKVTPDDLGLARGEIGGSGAKVKIERYLAPRRRQEVRLIPGEPADAALEAARILVDVERVI
jgi:electron transfer flavoprotein beta subunit